jgi:predicted TIM-barrel fold metal-dependent hydrolase
MSGEADVVIDRANKANTKITIVSALKALMPRLNANVISGNEEAFRVVKENRELLQWIVVDPRQHDTYKQASEMLKDSKCVGIKIHPEEHSYNISEYGRNIFEFASKFNTIVLTHSGEKNSLPDHFVEFADAFPNVSLILAHHGCSENNDPSLQVRAIQKSKNGNIFTDTSSATNVISRQIEWAVKEIGAEKLLYGTDSPLYFAPMQRARIDNAEITDKDKNLILCDNAIELFNLKQKIF